MQNSKEPHLSDGTLLLNRYRIKRFIDSGGFGNTYEAFDERFSERVAIKELFVSGICGRSADMSVTVSVADNRATFETHKQKFLREAVRLHKLAHKNIVKVSDVFEENGTVYYVMEYIEGKSLSKLLKERGRPFSEAEIMPRLEQLLDALDYVHSNGLLHLDIKPGNVMLRESDGNALLIDFGASKQFEMGNDGKSVSTQTPFTRGYAPTEQVEQDPKKYGAWTDIYALGATLFNLLTGTQPPLPSDIIENGMPDMPGVSRKMQKVIAEAMKQARNQRPQSVAAFREILNEKSAVGSLRTSEETEWKQVVPDRPKIKIDPPQPPVDSKPEKKESLRKILGIVGIVLGIIAVVIILSVSVVKCDRGKEREENWEATTEVPTVFGNETFTVNGVSFDMVAVEGGTFQMGATSEQWDDAWDSEKPVHSVTLSDYWIAETEVTQELWQAVMGNNPSNFTGNLQRPVENVSWDDCQEFVKKLNQMTDGGRPAGTKFRLPTEAEWEYAARGGKHKEGYKYSGSNDIDQVAWYDEDWNTGSTHPVAQKKANALGIYDMTGNVWEWCEDWYNEDYYSNSPGQDPLCKTPGEYSIRVLRGGSWYRSAWNCRVSIRGDYDPGFRGLNRGMRLALSSLH